MRSQLTPTGAQIAFAQEHPIVPWMWPHISTLSEYVIMGSFVLACYQIRRPIDIDVLISEADFKMLVQLYPDRRFVPNSKVGMGLSIVESDNRIEFFTEWPYFTNQQLFDSAIEIETRYGPLKIASIEMMYRYKAQAAKTEVSAEKHLRDCSLMALYFHTMGATLPTI